MAWVNFTPPSLRIPQNVPGVHGLIKCVAGSKPKLGFCFCFFGLVVAVSGDLLLLSSFSGNGGGDTGSGGGSGDDGGDDGGGDTGSGGGSGDDGGDDGGGDTGSGGGSGGDTGSSGGGGGDTGGGGGGVGGGGGGDSSSPVVISSSLSQIAPLLRMAASVAACFMKFSLRPSLSSPASYSSVPESSGPSSNESSSVVE